MYFSYNLHFLSLLYYFVSTFSIQLSSFVFFLFFFFIFSLTFLFLLPLLYFKAHDENKSMFLIILILVSYSDWIIFSFSLLRDGRQISHVILSEFKQISCLLFPRNHQKTIGFQMISGGLKVTYFAQIRLVFEMKFGDDPLGQNEI